MFHAIMCRRTLVSGFPYCGLLPPLPSHISFDRNVLVSEWIDFGLWELSFCIFTCSLQYGERFGKDGKRNVANKRNGGSVGLGVEGIVWVVFK